MKKNIMGFSLLLQLALITNSAYAVLVPTPSIAPVADVDRTFLPDNFPVYTNGHDLINHPLLDYKEKILPTNNDYKQTPGCYIACYSTDATASIYSPDDTSYLIGQVRVAGSYDGTSCKPIGFENKDISKVQKFSILCSASFAPCKGKHCWANGQTGKLLAS